MKKEQRKEARNIFEAGLNIANDMAPTIAESIEHQIKIKNIDSYVDSVIAHTIAMFVVCCSLNSDVLDNDTLESTFQQTKEVIKNMRDIQRGMSTAPEETVN